MKIMKHSISDVLKDSEIKRQFEVDYSEFISETTPRSALRDGCNNVLVLVILEPDMLLLINGPNVPSSCRYGDISIHQAAWDDDTRQWCCFYYGTPLTFLKEYQHRENFLPTLNALYFIQSMSDKVLLCHNNYNDDINNITLKTIAHLISSDYQRVFIKTLPFVKDIFYLKKIGESVLLETVTDCLINSMPNLGILHKFIAEGGRNIKYTVSNELFNFSKPIPDAIKKSILGYLTIQELFPLFSTCFLLQYLIR